jgi:N-acetylglucosamine-6-sulfatase
VTRKIFKHLLLFALLCLVASVGMTASQTQRSLAQTADPRPNILFILADDMRASDVDKVVNGQPVMPNTQEVLDKQGVEFEKPWVTRSLCCPSRATIFRGQYPHNHNVWVNVPPSGGYWSFHDQGLENSTVATWLNEAGYDTVLIGKYLNRYGLDLNGNYVPNPDVPPGWDEWYAWEGDYNSDTKYDINENGTIHTYFRSDTHDTDLHAQTAEKYIRRTEGGAPFFMHLSPNVPHFPSYYAPRHADMFTDTPLPRPTSFNEADVSDKPAWVRNKPRLSSADIGEMTGFYRDRLRALQSLDDMVGTLVGALRDTGELSNTYIVFTSDNGIYLGEHRLEAKAAAYNAAPRIPLLIRGPNVPQGVSRSQIVLNNDFAPTIASWAGVTPPAFVDGRSIEPLLTSNPPTSWRSAFLVEHRRTPEEFANVRAIPNYSAIRTNRYNYVEYDNVAKERELYDLDADPTELTNIYDTAPSTLISELHARLEALKSCAGAECRKVEWDDTTPPALDLPAEITEEAASASGTVVTFTATATDQDMTELEATCTPPSGSIFPIGETTVTCSVMDFPGNNALGSFKVTIRDTTPPTILGVPPDISEEATGPNGARVSWQLPTASDAVDGGVGVKCSSDSGLTAGDTFPLGTTRVTCEATDRAGNKIIESFVVDVSDTTPPEIADVPSDMTVTASSARGATVTYGVPTATDAVDGARLVRCTPESGSVFPLGKTTVICTATDSSGNVASERFDVSIAYAWSGVLQPLNADGSSIFKLGSTVPVKFRFIGDSAGITDATAKLYVAKFSDGVVGEEVEAISTAPAIEGNHFRYDPTGDQYVFTWSTRTLERGYYRLRIELGDQTTNTVLVSLR